MGYYMNIVDCNFLIKNENKVKVMETLKELVLENELYWVDTQMVTQETSFKSVMQECRWEVETEKNGDVCHISFCGEKLGSEDIIFNKIAPFVEKGSYIEVAGECGERWVWLFDGNNCRIFYPEKIYNEKENTEDISKDDLFNSRENLLRNKDL